MIIMNWFSAISSSAILSTSRISESGLTSDCNGHNALASINDVLGSWNE